VTEEEWAEHRRAVFGVAYRLLGTVSDAEDVEQDVWLRAHAAGLFGVSGPASSGVRSGGSEATDGASGVPAHRAREAVRDVRAWLVTVAARRAYDILRSARTRRETYVGPWLPEPLLTGPDASEPVLVDDSVSTAMLLVMEELSPPERVAFVLHDVFEVRFDRIAGVLGTTSAAARQLASRARRRVAAARAQPSAGRPERERVLAAFRAAYEAGDLKALVGLLHPDAIYVTDGGGKVSAALRVITGADRIARVLVHVAQRRGFLAGVPCEVGGELALAIHRDGRFAGINTFDIAPDGRIRALHRVLNPDKLAHLSHLPSLSRLPGEGSRREDTMPNFTPRLSVPEAAPDVYRALSHTEAAIRKGPLDPAVRELVKIRASQLNGCLFCIDMHVHEALELGESQDRIFQLTAWRESPLYSEAERAALAYTEAATELPAGVTDEVWNAVTKAFTPEETAYLVGQVAMINAWNRIAAPTHTQPAKR
jgi:AhpD family alkylhydroperoxidase